MKPGAQRRECRARMLGPCRRRRRKDPYRRP
jgi:hypothetical protein